MTPVFNELNKVMNDAIKRGETPGDIITALTSCVIGVINCLKVTPDVKIKLGKSAADMITGEIKS
jgi:hypothetical protein